MVVWRLEKRDGGGPWFTKEGGLREGGQGKRIGDRNREKGKGMGSVTGLILRSSKMKIRFGNLI